MAGTPDARSLALAARGGAVAALEAFWRAEHPRVWKLCLGMLASRAEADDAAQDALLALIDRLASYDAARPYEAWRTTLVLNHCRDRLRRAEARARAESSAPAPERAPREHDPLHALERADAQRQLLAALALLPAREREAFVLLDLEARPTAEVAAAMGIGESSARSLLALARARLRRALAPQVPELVDGGEA